MGCGAGKHAEPASLCMHKEERVAAGEEVPRLAAGARAVAAAAEEATTVAESIQAASKATVIADAAETSDVSTADGYLDVCPDDSPLAFVECQHMSGEVLMKISIGAQEPASALVQRIVAGMESNGPSPRLRLLLSDKEMEPDLPLSEQGVTAGAHVVVTVVVIQAMKGSVMLSPGTKFGSASGRVQAYLDDETNGGKWILMWCYAHEGGTNPDLVPNKLPADPEKGFSHANFQCLSAGFGAQLKCEDVQEVRFYARSSGHNRVMHFKTGNLGVKRMVAGEAGDAAGFNTCAASGAGGWWQGNNWTALDGHSATLPRSGNGWWGSFGHFFVYEAGVRTWAIKGSGYRWEVDDHVAHRECAGPVANADGYDGTSRTTLHQIWVRFNDDAVTYI
jgi:hypothetical protein